MLTFSRQQDGSGDLRMMLLTNGMETIASLRLTTGYDALNRHRFRGSAASRLRRRKQDQLRRRRPGWTSSEHTSASSGHERNGLKPLIGRLASQHELSRRANGHLSDASSACFQVLTYEGRMEATELDEFGTCSSFQ